MERTEERRGAARARSTTVARWWHAVTCAVGAFGVIAQLWIVATQTLTPDMVQLATPVRLWNVLSYFTIWSNVLVTGVAYLLARDPHRDGRWFTTFRLASVAMITVTGLIYALVLAQVWDPTGWQKVADQTLHYSVPALAVLGFLVFGPRPRADLATLGRSLLVPISWTAYTLVRSPFITYDDHGATRHWYPYHFINVDDLGYGRALLNIAGVSLLLVAVGGVFVLLDRKLAPRP